MFFPLQFDRVAVMFSLYRRNISVLLGILVLFSCASIVCAQDAPPGAVGRVEGNDVSVDGGTAASMGTVTAAPSMFVANGGVVTVHSGQAHLVLAAGGELEICGPAKLTVLESSGAITIALNFGRVHIELPATINLKVFTPSIIATPIDIGGMQRDIAVGLNLDDSLCVLATSGALELEHQFTGEKLIVPQSGEFFLNAGQLSPVAGTPGSCQCTEMQTRATVAPPARSPVSQASASDEAMLSMPALATPAAALETPAASAPQPAAAPEPGVSYSALANEAHPVTTAPKNSIPATPAITVPTYTAVSPLVYSAANPTPPDPGPDVVLLIRAAQVDPDFKFSGQVEVPEFAKSMQKALGVTPAEALAAAPQQAPAKEKKSGGFWHSLKQLFGGDQPNREGAG